MSIRKAAPIVGAILVPALLFIGLLALAGSVGASPPRLDPPVDSEINYQGQLADPGGTPLDGTFPMRFQLYDAATGGTMLWDSGAMNVDVDHGLFNVKLVVDPTDFNGQALWLRVYVDGEWLSPRQEILPVPYALSLRPQARIHDTESGITLDVLNFATGSAVRAVSTSGYGLYGYSDHNYGVYGQSTSTSLSAGYFKSEHDKAIVAITSGTGFWDSAGFFKAMGGGPGVWGEGTDRPGVYGKSYNSHGVYGETYGTSANDYGVYGEAGGSGYGVYGYQSSTSGGLGVYGKNEGTGAGVSGYNAAGGTGTWGYSMNGNALGSMTGRVDNNYGLYTPDNIYSLNYHSSGALMHVAQNGGDETLERGDVVVIAGLGESPAEGIPPMLRVRKALEANSTAVVGVVASTYSAEWLTKEARLDPTGSASLQETIPLAVPGPIAPGGYMLIVVQGPCQVKADAITGSITPGDLLSSAGRAGRAAKAAEVSIEGVKTTVPGSTFGKALEPLDRGQEGLIWVFATLH